MNHQEKTDFYLFDVLMIQIL